MKNTLTVRQLSILVDDMVNEEFETFELIYPNGYEKDDLKNDLFEKYYCKIYPQLDKIAFVARENGHLLTTYVRRQLWCSLSHIRRKFLTEYKYFSKIANEALAKLQNEDFDEWDAVVNRKAWENSPYALPRQLSMIESIEAREEVGMARDGMSDRDNYIIDMYIEGYTQREIADEVGISQPAVLKVLNKLKGKLHETGNDERRHR